MCASRATRWCMVPRVAVLRCTLKLRDGRVHIGYTPAFDPADRSLWLTATPDSPAGTMFTLERARVVVLESLDGRPVVLPTSTRGAGGEVTARAVFADGEVLTGRRSGEVPGIGVWLEPPGRGRARAFVPTEAAERIDEVSDEGDSFDAIERWAFLPAEPSLPPSLSSLTMPVSPAALRGGGSLSMPPPSRLMPSASSIGGGADATPTDAIPAVSASDVDAQHTQPVALPLVAPPVPPTSRTWPDGSLSESSSITTPDLPMPALDE